MQRMKKAREDRERVKVMHTRGIPGTVTDEAMLQQLQFKTNSNYKATFSTYKKPQTSTAKSSYQS